MQHLPKVFIFSSIFWYAALLTYKNPEDNLLLYFSAPLKSLFIMHIYLLFENLKELSCKTAWTLLLTWR